MRVPLPVDHNQKATFGNPSRVYVISLVYINCLATVRIACCQINIKRHYDTPKTTDPYTFPKIDWRLFAELVILIPLAIPVGQNQSLTLRLVVFIHGNNAGFSST